MSIAFGIVSLFPDGGLQRNCLAIARLLAAHGHGPAVFASRMSGALPDDVPIKLLPNNAWTNHGRNRQFAKDFAAATAGRFSYIVGFDKLSSLDMLYCATLTVAAGNPLRRLTPRYRVLRALEGASFARGGETRIIALSEPQIEGYRAAWNTEPERITLLPPNIERQRHAPQLRTDGTRQRRRATLGLHEGDWCWLAIGRQAHTKGLDRTIEALAAFPSARLFVVGLSASDPAAQPMLRAAGRLGVGHRFVPLGFVGDDDVLALTAAADLLVHPARVDTTGTVILEAIINGLPVVTTAVCGYARHVREADAGLVVSAPFAQRSFVEALRTAEGRRQNPDWSENGMRYGQQSDLYRGLEIAAETILRLSSETAQPAEAKA